MHCAAGIDDIASDHKYSDPDDPTASELRREIENEGPQTTIQRVCGLNLDGALGRLVREDCDRLLNGRDGGRVLLSLRPHRWNSR